MKKSVLFTGIIIVAFASLLNAEENIPKANISAKDNATLPSIMEDLASEEAVTSFVKGNDQPYFLFGEDRVSSIRRFDALPKHWLKDTAKYLDRFEGKANPGEFYVFQIGLFASRGDVGPVSLEYAPLCSGQKVISGDRFRCFNLGGIDYTGRPFQKEIVVKQGRLQPLWIGVEIPEDAQGTYKGVITVKPVGSPARKFRLSLDVSGQLLEDHGDKESWRLTRLRWLDSRIGLNDDAVTAPYIPLAREDNQISLLGKKLTVGLNGLPEQFESFFNSGNTAITRLGKDFLAAPFTLIVETDEGIIHLEKSKLSFTRQQKGAIEWTSVSENDMLSITCNGLMEYDGFISCKAFVRARRDLNIKDIRLETAVNDNGKLLWMGLNREGCLLPDKIDWKWQPKYRQDDFWLGNVNAGFRLQLKGKNYRTPLVNAYYEFHRLNMPESWYNGGKGGIIFKRDSGQMKITAYSGRRTLKSGQELLYQFDMNLTPFKCVNTDKHWANRYYHPNGNDKIKALGDPARVKKELGANIVNIHHSFEYNPVINYPYWEQSFPSLQRIIKKAHKEDVRVKIYYTTREITNQLPELWSFYSLNGEIVFPGPGKDARPVTNRKGPHPWLLEHLRENFIPAWRQTLKAPYEGYLDLSVITTPDSRLDNFYLEGLKYTIEHANIDGLYIDDTSLGRKSFQRARRILLANNPDSLLDLHSWRGCWQPRWGRCIPLLSYIPQLPYFDRIWLGEGFMYNEISPENWLVEVSGLPFGLMGEMLQHGGNPWRGMLFGETTRLGWHGDPRPIWKLWDDFGIQGSEMLGWWDERCPVRTGHKDIKATAYKKDGKTLICLASWARETVECSLQIDWQALGLDPSKATLYAPQVKSAMPNDKKNLQNETRWNPGDKITVSPGKGWLIYLWKI